MSKEYWWKSANTSTTVLTREMLDKAFAMTTNLRGGVMTARPDGAYTGYDTYPVDVGFEPQDSDLQYEGLLPGGRGMEEAGYMPENQRDPIVTEELQGLISAVQVPYIRTIRSLGKTLTISENDRTNMQQHIQSLARGSIHRGKALQYLLDTHDFDEQTERVIRYALTGGE